MQGNLILTENYATNNRQALLLVRTTKALKTDLTGLIIPQGAYGKILAYDNQILTIDFGLQTVHRIAVNSALIQIVRV